MYGFSILSCDVYWLLREERSTWPKIVFSLFRNARQKKNQQENVGDEKKGGETTLFGITVIRYGGYRRERINHSDWLNLIRMASERMESSALTNNTKTRKSFLLKQANTSIIKSTFNEKQSADYKNKSSTQPRLSSTSSTKEKPS